ncbi:hypothetical protein BJY04DRAFT_222495 [Aspergillus karnatakaensis]|uniref:uncharacterized protein n=1 Tax=Aspergillus karnatakaensis TaxID=1810916 RepID=UPI003CCE3267
MLRKIHKVHQPDALRLLQLLLYSVWPLTIEEAMDAILVDIGSNPAFDPDLRMPDPEEIATICPGLISITRITHESLPPWASDSDYDSDDSSWSNTAQTGVAIDPPVQKELIMAKELQIAHLSVREYLLSGRVPVAVLRAGLERTAATMAIAKTCLEYMCYLGYSYQSEVEAYISKCESLELNSHGGQKRRELSTEITARIQKECPLANYATYNWARHAFQVQDQGSIQKSIIAALRDVQSPLSLWSHVYMGVYGTSFYQSHTCGPITYLSRLEFKYVVPALLRGFVPGDHNLTADIAECFLDVCENGNPEINQAFLRENTPQH